MKFIYIILLCVLFVPCVFGQVVAPSDEISVDTALINVPVTVSDRDDRYISGLTIQDFSLLRDGKPQKIDFFGAEEEPINVALLLDTSPSTANVIDQIKRAAVSFINLLEKDDRAMIVTFDTEIRQISPLTSNRIELERAIRNADIGYSIGTVMRDAVARTLSGSFGKLPGRKAVILLTDGMDFGSGISEGNLLYQLEESDALIYTVYYKTEMRVPGNRRTRRRVGSRGIRFPSQRRQMPDRQKKGRDFLKKISETTAGRYYDKNIEDLGPTFGLIVDELRKQYRIAFYVPENDVAGEIHTLKVKVNRKNVSVRTRASYRAK